MECPTLLHTQDLHSNDAILNNHSSFVEKCKNVKTVCRPLFRPKATHYMYDKMPYFSHDTVPLSPLKDFKNADTGSRTTSSDRARFIQYIVRKLLLQSVWKYFANIVHTFSGILLCLLMRI